MFKVVLYFAIAAIASCQTLTKLQWTQCPTGTHVIKVLNMDATPMPIRHPGIMNLVFTAQNSEIIKGVVKGDINIVRSVSGLNLKISCYLVDGTYVGSCIYNDLCGVIKSVLNLDPTNCPASLVSNGIDCNCPWNLPVKLLDINENFDLPDATTSKISWIASGDFNVDMKGTQQQGLTTKSILCMNIKFSVKPK